MRANQSSTASGMYSRFGTYTAAQPFPMPLLPGGADEQTPASSGFDEVQGSPSEGTRAAQFRQSAWPFRPDRLGPSPDAPAPPRPRGGVADGPGLAHDAGNLLGALRLYCDLLAAPGVLRAEHKHYAEELRQLSGRSGTLIERLVGYWRGKGPAVGDEGGQALLAAAVEREPAYAARCGQGLGRVVEGCGAVLRGVAGGRRVEAEFGPAAHVAVELAPESLERILVNLVRNAASSMEGRDGEQAIRVRVGFIVNRAKDSEPGLCRRVRLTVEDRGAGMSRTDLDRLSQATRSDSRGRRGLGLRVVRELVQQSGGEVRITSEVGEGTCVQIEWPVRAVTIAPAKSIARARLTAPTRAVRSQGLARRGGSHAH